MPDISRQDAELISRTIMNMRGSGNTKKGRKALEKGDLWLKRKPFTYRRINCDWQRGLATGDWTKQPSHPIDSVDDQPMENLKCPECNKQNPVKTLRIKDGVHFSNLKCRMCKVVGSSRRWNCACGVPWTRCRLHVLPVLAKGSHMKEGSTSRKRKVPIDHPLHAKRPHDVTAVVPLVSVPRRPIVLVPGSRLAMRFPQHVKSGSADQRADRC